MRANVIQRLIAGRLWDGPMTVLANGFFFFALLPFVSPLPGRSDVQLPAFVLAAAVAAADVVRGQFRLRALEYGFLAIAVWSFCFVLPDGVFTLRERVGLPLAFLTYYVVKKHADRFAFRVLYGAIALNFGAAVFQMVFPDTYVALAPHVVRTVKIAGFMGRGMSGLSAEPSFLAAMALSHGLLVFYFWRSSPTPGPSTTPGVVFTSLTNVRTTPGVVSIVTGLLMSLGALVLSRAATGFVFGVILLGIALLYFAIKGMRLRLWTVLLLAAMMAAVLITGPLAESRGGLILTALYKQPSRVLGDGSVQERTRCLTIGVLSLLHHPFGSGGGSFPAVAEEINDRYQLHSAFKFARPETFNGVLNAGGLYLVEIGFIFVLLLAIVLVASFRLEVFHMMFTWLAMMFILVTFSIAFPLTWVLLGIAAKRTGPPRTPLAASAPA